MKEEILKGLSQAVVDGDVDKAKQFAQEAIANKIDAYEAIMEGCAKGMNEVSHKYETGECYVPEVLCSAEAMNEAMAILKPYVKVDPPSFQTKSFDEVLALCKDNIAQGMNSPSGFILMPGCEMPPLAPPINVHAMLVASRQMAYK